MSIDDVLSFATDRRWRRYLTTPLLPLFWLARTTRRVTCGLARRLGVHRRSPSLARRLGLRNRIDYGFFYAELARIDDEMLIQRGQPGKTLEEAIGQAVSDDPKGWRIYTATLWFFARTEAERLADRCRDALDVLRSRTRTAGDSVADALPARLGQGEDS